MKIVADENMYAVQEYFSPFGEVVLLPGRSISNKDLLDADVLLVRSVTQVSERILANTPVKFVGSATIGVDHIDQQYLEQRNIAFAYAPGCNAGAVVQYVLSVMAALVDDWQQKTVGIIGCGNVGGSLYRVLNNLGVNCRCYDPFLTNAQQKNLCSLEQALQADIVSLHTPLTVSGAQPTFHLLAKAQLNLINKDALLINSGRGAVIDNAALLAALNKRSFRCALDVWENEPEISLPLLQQVQLATPHIAGYSLDGKLKGTQMLCDAFSDWQKTEGPKPLQPFAKPAQIRVSTVNQAILQSYDVQQDDQQMRSCLLGAKRQQNSVAEQFDKLRKNYPPRLEFAHFQAENTCPDDTKKALALLGFATNSNH